MWNKGLSYRNRHGLTSIGYSINDKNLDVNPNAIENAGQLQAGMKSAERVEDRQTLGLVFFPAFDWKISETHPERQERLLYTRDQIVEEGLLDLSNIREYNPIVADWDTIERVHVGAPDLASWVTEAHRVSAGGAIAAADAVLSG